MIGLAAFIMLAFYGLAICTMGGILSSGLAFGLAITVAIVEVKAGMIIARLVYTRA